MHPTRRLAAVMLADVAGYSRLMEQDEQGTHLRLREIRSQVTDPAIERHRGRIVHSRGDDLLVEFASAVEALSCAVEIQRQMGERNRDLAPESRIEFRIGINLGDILIDGSEIAGDGVNVAARLEALALPGEVAISSAVREQVRQLVGVRLADAGHHRVHNISRPIRVFKVRIDGQPRRRWSAWLNITPARRNLLLLAAMSLLAIGLAWWQPWGERQVARQSLAVMPISAEGDHSAVASALTSEISVAMSHMLVGTVAAPAAAARFKDLSHDPSAIGRQLKVRYLLEATVSGDEQQLRLSARLVRTDNSAQLWASTIRAPRVPGETVPLELIGRLVNVIAAEIRRAELSRPRPGGPDALELVLRAETLMPNTETNEQLREVRRMYEQALKLEPEFVPALSGLANALAFEGFRAATPEEGRPLLQQGAELSLKAISLGANDAEAWRVRASVLQMTDQMSAAEAAVDRSLAINPYSSEAHAQRGRLLQAMGRGEEAIKALDLAIRLNPDAESVGVHLYVRCRALLYLGRYADAIDTCTRGMAFAPDWPDFMLMTAAYAMQGDMARAEQARKELMTREPNFSIEWLKSRSPSSHTAANEQREKHLFAGLRKAGVPEKTAGR